MTAIPLSYVDFYLDSTQAMASISTNIVASANLASTVVLAGGSFGKTLANSAFIASKSLMSVK